MLGQQREQGTELLDYSRVAKEWSSEALVATPGANALWLMITCVLNPYVRP